MGVESLRKSNVVLFIEVISQDQLHKWKFTRLLYAMKVTNCVAVKHQVFNNAALLLLRIILDGNRNDMTLEFIYFSLFIYLKPFD